MNFGLDEAVGNDTFMYEDFFEHNFAQLAVCGVGLGADRTDHSADPDRLEP